MTPTTMATSPVRCVSGSRRDSLEYLRLHSLEPYLEDAVLWALYSEDKLSPRERLRDYFKRVLALENINGREYAYTGSTAWNRRAFVVAFHVCVDPLRDMDLSIMDFHQLLLVLCPDFPRATLDAIIHVLPRALQQDGKFHCGTLATAFQVHWYHANFLAGLDPFFRRAVRIEAGELVPTGREDGESAALPFPELAEAVTYLNAAQGGRKAHPSAIAWPVVAQCLAKAGFRDAVSFRRLCQCLIQSDVLARRLHTKPLVQRDLAAILEGRPPRGPRLPVEDAVEEKPEPAPAPAKPRRLRKKVNAMRAAGRKREPRAAAGEAEAPEEE